MAGSRREAIALGARYYFTGKPCKRGGIAPRRASDQMCTCVECEKDRRARNRANYGSKKETILEQKREYYAKTREVARKRQREYRIKNIDRIRAKTREWMLANPARVAANSARRKTRIRRATPGWYGEFDRFVEIEAYRLARLRAAVTGFKWHVDHMIPVVGRRVCGLHVWQNLQVIPWLLNVMKGNRLRWCDPGEWFETIRDEA
jgi:hypothetical protein